METVDRRLKGGVNVVPEKGLSQDKAIVLGAGPSHPFVPGRLKSTKLLPLPGILRALQDFLNHSFSFPFKSQPILSEQPGESFMPFHRGLSPLLSLLMPVPHSAVHPVHSSLKLFSSYQKSSALSRPLEVPSFFMTPRHGFDAPKHRVPQEVRVLKRIAMRFPFNIGIW